MYYMEFAVYGKDKLRALWYNYVKCKRNKGVKQWIW